MNINPLSSITHLLYYYKVQVKLFFCTPFRGRASGGIISPQLKFDIGWRLVLGLRHECFALQECTSDNRSHKRLVGSQIRSGRFLERPVSCLCLCCTLHAPCNKPVTKKCLQICCKISILIIHCSYMFRPYNLAFFREPMPLL